MKIILEGRVDWMIGLSRHQVELVPYSPDWAKLYTQEARRLDQVIGPYVQGIEHVGSTAIPGLKAKPIIDILVGVETPDAEKRCTSLLESLGYTCKGESGVAGRLFFSKGEEELRTHYLHLSRWGSDFWNQLITFRNALRQDESLVRAYADLKEDLALRYSQDRPAYTAGKADFIQRVINQYSGG